MTTDPSIAWTPSGAFNPASAADEAMARGIVAQQHDQIGSETIGRVDDRANTIHRHPGTACVDIGDHRNFESEVGRPISRTDIVPGNLGPAERLDQDYVGRQREARNAKRREDSKKPAPRDHWSLLALRRGRSESAWTASGFIEAAIERQHPYDNSPDASGRT
jgi:hypothetical protein